MSLKKVISCSLAGFMALAPAAYTNAASSTISSPGKVTLYDQEGRASSSFTGRNLYSEGTMVMCQDGCAIKSKGVSILADKGTVMATSEKDGVFDIVLKQGQVNFVVLDPSVKINFHTTHGIYTVADVLQNASTSSAVKGYFLASEKSAEVGMVDGGMTFATANGFKRVNAGDKIILAMAQLPAALPAIIPSAAAAAAPAAPALSTGTVVAGTLATGAAGTAGVAAAINANDDDDDKTKTASPSQ